MPFAGAGGNEPGPLQTLDRHEHPLLRGSHVLQAKTRCLERRSQTAANRKGTLGRSDAGGDTLRGVRLGLGLGLGGIGGAALKPEREIHSGIAAREGSLQIPNGSKPPTDRHGG